MKVDVSYSSSPPLPDFTPWNWFRKWTGVPVSCRISSVGLLTCASSGRSAFPFLNGTVAVFWPVLHAYSGGAVLDFHQLPMLLPKGFQDVFENNTKPGVVS